MTDRLADEKRCRRLIEASARKFDLDLAGMTVLTEAATGYYALTPMIAALADADRVLALTRDSRFGSAAEITAATSDLADRWQVSDRIEILTSRDDSRLSDADIATNLGFVRPFDAAFLARLKPTVTIPLMWETWEYREQDLDLASCRRLQIPVLGTNEHHPALKTIDFVGAIALKLLCELDIEPIDGRVGIIGSGDFATAVERVLSSLGTKTFRISPADEELADESRLQLVSADALVIVEHHNRRTLIGQGGVLDEDELREMNAGLAVAHICGGVNRDILRARGFRCAPERFAEPGYMSVATDYVGPRPLIDLHTAGFKVGAVLASHVRSGLRGFDAEVATLATTDLAQGFAGYHPAPGQLAQKVLS